MIRANRKNILARIEMLREKAPPILDCGSPQRMAFAIRELAREFASRDLEILELIGDVLKLKETR